MNDARFRRVDGEGWVPLPRFRKDAMPSSPLATRHP